MMAVREAAPVLFAVALLGSPSVPGVSGQVATAGVSAHSYAIGDAAAVGLGSMSLVTLPWSATSPVVPGLSLTVNGAYARASAEASGQRIDISGLMDSRVGVRARWRGIGLSAGASIPSGEVARSLEGATLVGLLSSDLLPFPVRRWGSGLGFDGDLDLTVTAGRARVVLSGGYGVNGEFAPLGDEAGQYTPGPQLRTRLQVSRELGAAGVLTVVGGMQRFAYDAVNDVDLLQSGTRVQVAASYAFTFGARESAVAFAALRLRGDATPASTARVGTTPIEVTLSGAQVPLARHLIIVGSDVRIGRGRYAVVPGARLRLLRSPSGVGQGWVATVGSRVEYLVAGERMGRRLVLVPDAAVRVGRVIPFEGASSRLVGWALGVTARWDLR